MAFHFPGLWCIASKWHSGTPGAVVVGKRGEGGEERNVNDPTAHIRGGMSFGAGLPGADVTDARRSPPRPPPSVAGTHLQRHSSGRRPSPPNGDHFQRRGDGHGQHRIGSVAPARRGGGGGGGAGLLLRRGGSSSPV